MQHTRRTTSTSEPPPTGTSIQLEERSDLLAAPFVLAVAFFLFTGFLAGLFLAGMLPPSLAKFSYMVPFAGSLAGIGILAIILKPHWVYYGILFLCLVSFETVEALHIPLGLFKLYVQDVALAFNLGLVLLRWASRKIPPRRIPWNRYLLIYFCLGIFSVVYSLLVRNQPYDRVFGHFRRTFVYFLNYFVAISLLCSLNDVFRFRRLLVIGSGLLILKGIFQAATGQFYYRRFGDAAHILSHIELTFLSFGVFYALARVFWTQGTRIPYGLYAVSGILITILGNYRASWLGLAGGLFFLYLFQPVRRRLQILGITFGVLILTGLAMYALWDVEVLEHSTLGNEIVAKANVKNAPLDINVIWRFDSYRAAIEQWREHPWLGAGIGTSLEFHTLTSTGQSILTFDHSVHNGFLWLWMTQGILGFPIAMLPHIAFLVITIRYLRRTTWPEGKVTVLACTAYAISMLISTAFEHFLESGTTITVYSAIVALAMLTIYYTPPSALTTETKPRPMTEPRAQG